MNDQSISCVRVKDSDVELGVEQPEKYSAAARLTLGQFWKGPDALPAERAHALVGASETGLNFYVYLRDSDIYSRATADDQKMWTLGDVAEFFIKPGGGRTDYWEIHITPNDFIMDIYIPDRERFMAGKISWDEVVAPSSQTRKRVQVGDGYWAVEACVPWAAFGLNGIPEGGVGWHIAVCRYNYAGGSDDPELSSTASFSQASFHRHEEYTQLVF
jgi:hypothetical protein